MGRLFRSHAVARTVPAFLVGLQFVSVVTVYPDYLSYFNETIGDPQNGWRYLSDSNIDWGQDLPALAEFVEENEIDRISLAYFGAGSPAFYAIPFENIAVPNVFGTLDSDPLQAGMPSASTGSKAHLERNTANSSKPLETESRSLNSDILFTSTEFRERWRSPRVRTINSPFPGLDDQRDI